MPGIYHENQFDVAGTIVGALDQAMILPRSIEPGDLLVGLASSGPHTNGYSLIRKVFDDVSLEHIYPELGAPLADFLLAPHRNYLPVLTPALKANLIRGLAHITGGGFIDNIPRILPEGCGAIIHKASWEVHALFKLIQKLGNIDPDEMYRVFNMGIGMVAVIAPKNLEKFQSSITETTWVIGQVIAGEGISFQ